MSAALAVAGLWTASAWAAPPATTPTAAPVRVQLVAPDTLIAGAHANIAVEVELAADSGSPIVLTPNSEGSAVEVVRGRLLLADAKRTDARHFHFDVPVIAKAEGTAILRVELSTYVCTPRCRYTVVTASQTLRVSAH